MKSCCDHGEGTVKKPDHGGSSVNPLLVVGIIVVLSFIAYNQYAMWSLTPQVDSVTGNTIMEGSDLTDAPQKTVTFAPFSTFDKELAHTMMDQNGDGLCDTCGMPVDQCTTHGMVQCSMNGTQTSIGVLGSAHNHADWKIYLDGKPFNFTPIVKPHDEYEHEEQSGSPSESHPAHPSAFMHMHPGAGVEKDGDVIHMHASGVPFWFIFESNGMNISETCIEVGQGKRYCSSGDKTLKFYVNGKQQSSIRDYVFADLDKILISYGNESDPQITKQLESITDLSASH